MKRNAKQIEGRKTLVRLAVNNKRKAADCIRQYADALEKTRTTEQVIHCLSNILFLSEQTIENDIYC